MYASAERLRIEYLRSLMAIEEKQHDVDSWMEQLIGSAFAEFPPELAKQFENERKQLSVTIDKLHVARLAPALILADHKHMS